jgi:riboflavin synthase
MWKSFLQRVFMFSGIVTALGRITKLTPRDDGASTVRLTIDGGGFDMSDVAVGDSIACGGVCLTVVARDAQTFSADVSPETLSCTVGLSALGPVNLEKALRLSDRLGGHLVSGHVDGFGDVLRFDSVGDNRLLVMRAPQNLARYIARKGSICINGVSLTTNSVDGAEFSINLIPHTLEMTTLGALKPGDRVNLEIDLIARYVERMLNAPGGAD